MRHRLPESSRPRLGATRPALVLLAAALVAGTAACRKDRADTAADTIAVPAAAVDTTEHTRTDSTTGAAVTVGTPGAGTAQSGRDAAAGVDTPITRRIKSGEKP